VEILDSPTARCDSPRKVNSAKAYLMYHQHILCLSYCKASYAKVIEHMTVLPQWARHKSLEPESECLVEQIAS
jgi:hypothetical protein